MKRLGVVAVIAACAVSCGPPTNATRIADALATPGVTPSTVKYFSDPGGGPAVGCELHPGVASYAGPAAALVGYPDYFIVDKASDVSIPSSVSPDAIGERDRRVVAVHVSRALRGAQAQGWTNISLSARATQDVQAAFERDGTEVLVGSGSRGGQDVALVVTSTTAKALGVCKGVVTEGLTRFISRAADQDARSAVEKLLAAPNGTAPWIALEDKPKDRSWSQVDPEKRALDPESSVPPPADLMNKLGTVNLQLKLPKEWLGLPIVFCPKVSGLAWNNCVAVNASRTTQLSVPAYWQPGSPLELWATDTVSTIEKPLFLVGSVDASVLARAGVGGTIIGTTDSTASTLEMLQKDADAPSHIMAFSVG
jgi:hypothetical protein